MDDLDNLNEQVILLEKLKDMDLEMIKHYEEMLKIITRSACVIANRLETNACLANDVLNDIMLESASDLREMVEPVMKMINPTCVNECGGDVCGGECFNDEEF